MKVQTVVRLTVLMAVAGLHGACIPYAVGATARPTPKNQTQQAVSVFGLPHTMEIEKLPSDRAAVGIDIEVRRGITERSDIGLRFASASGFVLTYKRRLDGPSDKRGAGVALQVGGGIVDYTTHGGGEATLIVSGGEEGRFTPYGGLRAVGTIALSDDASYDEPVFGGFTGFRFGTANLGMSAEVGVFRDSNQFVKFGRNIIVVPSLSFHYDILNAIDSRRGKR